MTDSRAASESGITHVLFDFFGTLVSYDDRWAAQAYPRSHGLLLEAGADVDYEGFVDGMDREMAAFEAGAQRTLNEYAMDVPCEAFLRRVLPSPPDDGLLPAFRDTFLHEWAMGVRPIEGVDRMLADLAGRFTLVLLSNTHRAEMVRTLLADIGAAPYFRTVVTSVEHGKRKPSPLIFHDALAAVGGTPDRAVYVGDSYAADYLGATGAGLRCLLIDLKRRHDLPEDDRLSHVLEVPERLASLAPR